MDLAPMHGHEGVFYAIQSLAGIYIYDYLPEERVRNRINQRYVQADEYLTKLLNSPNKSGGAAEAIAITVVLSLQDVSGTWPFDLLSSEFGLYQQRLTRVSDCSD